MARMKMQLAALLLVASLALAGCGPEAQRTRGGGPGADPGNRHLGVEVHMHGPRDPSYDTPTMGRAIEVISNSEQESNE